MKRIGYIYKYNEYEQKGILVYNHWKPEYKINNKPIKFTVDDCKTAVKTGNLVYFELTETGVSNIERASLANFDQKIIEEITTWRKGDNYGNWYFGKTHITFEYLGDIIIPSADSEVSNIRKQEDCFDLWESRYIFDELPYYNVSNPIEIATIPNTIDDLFNYFGKFEHDDQFKDNCACVDILDMYFWIDEEIQKEAFYGSTVLQVSHLYDIFINRKYIDEKGNSITPYRENNCISDSWKLILSKFSDDELRQIILENPMLQPALPYRFCIENLDALHEGYGMPDVEICKAYNQYQIAKTNIPSEYQQLRRKFYTYANCTTRHLDGEGTPMCSMGKRSIEELESSLEDRFENVITPTIKTKFASISGISFDTLSSIGQEQVSKALLCVGRFIEAYENITNKAFLFEELYKAMPVECQNVLYEQVRIYINSSVLEYSKNAKTSPSDLRSHMYWLQEWIDDSTLKNIPPIVNERFAAIDDVEELACAYELDFITEEQYYNGFRSSSKELSVSQLALESIRSFSTKPFPLTIQWHIVSRIIDFFNFQSLNSYKYVKLGTVCGEIKDIRSLLKWIKYGSSGEEEIVRKAENHFLSVLTNEEKWILFEEGLLSTPGTDNIKAKLANMYEHGNFDPRLFRAKFLKKECFQDAMYEDILSSDDIGFKSLIADLLDAQHWSSLRNQAEGAFKLRMWIKNIDENYDWNLISSHFADLPNEQQIKLFRYVCSLIAKKKIILSIDELYDMFVKSEKKVCPTICGIIYLLKKKISAPNMVIKTEVFERIIGGVRKNINNISLAKTFFHECNGHLALTHTERGWEQYEKQTYNGYIDKIVIQGENYYSITFYRVPRNVFYDQDCLNEKNILVAKSVLETNLKAQIIDGKYIIADSEKIVLKQFVIAYNIEDHCNLFGQQTAHNSLYTNYIRPYDEEIYYVCRDINYNDIDPKSDLPFYWCNKKPCIRRCHYILPISEWEQYKFSDFLYIFIGCNKSNLTQIWSITSEISQLMHNLTTLCPDYFVNYMPKVSCIINEANEIGCMTEDFSVVQDINDCNVEEDMDYGGGYYEGQEHDSPTYNRYGGTYAQDEMEYSDDDIDTIFDGDPSAYWNID